MSGPREITSAEGIVADLLMELADLPDDAPARGYAWADVTTGEVYALTVGEVRRRLRELVELQAKGTA